MSVIVRRAAELKSCHMPVNGPANLVCQYLENISREALENYPALIREYIHRRPGIYALYRKKKLYYIGLTTNLRARLDMHRRDRHAKAWDSFSVYLTVGGEHLRELEALLLRIYERRGNRSQGRFKKAEDLTGRFRQDLKEEHNREVEKMFQGMSGDRRERERRLSPREREGRKPTLAPFAQRRFRIRMTHKGKMYIANVRSDGSITFARESAESRRLQGKVYTSPSGAAAAVTGYMKNGWTAWSYERAPGDWVPLDELRK